MPQKLIKDWRTAEAMLPRDGRHFYTRIEGTPWCVFRDPEYEYIYVGLHADHPRRKKHVDLISYRPSRGSMGERIVLGVSMYMSHLGHEPGIMPDYGFTACEAAYGINLLSPFHASIGESDGKLWIRRQYSPVEVPFHNGMTWDQERGWVHPSHLLDWLTAEEQRRMADKAGEYERRYYQRLARERMTRPETVDLFGHEDDEPETDEWDELL